MAGRSSPKDTKDVIATSTPTRFLSNANSATEVALGSAKRRPTVSSQHSIPGAEASHQRNDSCLSTPIVTSSKTLDQVTVLVDSAQTPNESGNHLLHSMTTHTDKVDGDELAEYGNHPAGTDHPDQVDSIDESADDLSDVDSLLEIEQIVRTFSRDRTREVHVDEDEDRGRARTRSQYRCVQN